MMHSGCAALGFAATAEVGIRIYVRAKIADRIADPPDQSLTQRRLDVCNESMQASVTRGVPSCDPLRERADGAKEVEPTHARGVQKFHEHARRDRLKLSFCCVRVGVKANRLHRRFGLPLGARPPTDFDTIVTRAPLRRAANGSRPCRGRGNMQTTGY